MNARVPSRTVYLAALLLAVFAAGCGGEGVDGPSPVGLYALDREAYARALLQGEAPGQDRAETVARARQQAAQLDIQLALEADGSFVVRYRFGREEGRYRGTWRHDGGRVTLVTTHAPGGPLGTARTTVARHRPDGLWFDEGAVPRPFVLRRR